MKFEFCYRGEKTSDFQGREGKNKKLKYQKKVIYLHILFPKKENMWKNLNNPPVAVALLQIKYNVGQFDLKSFLEFDLQLKKEFPIRKENLQVGIDLGKTSIPLGVSKVSATSNATLTGYIYASKDQKRKIELLSDGVTYIDETSYQGWDLFKKKALNVLTILSPLLQTIEIKRTSIRFVNRIPLLEFNKPTDYINIIISSVHSDSQPYPLRQYGFRLTMDIPDSDIYSIVNHNIESVPENKYLYTLDIDVLDKQCLIFDLGTISDNIEKLREVKNTIFFDSLTEKTLDLCNSKD